MGKKMTDRQHDKIIEITKEIYIKLQKKKKLYSIIDRVLKSTHFVINSCQCWQKKRSTRMSTDMYRLYRYKLYSQKIIAHLITNLFRIHIHLFCFSCPIKNYYSSINNLIFFFFLRIMFYTNITFLFTIIKI
jgi:hypothetical protein